MWGLDATSWMKEYFHDFLNASAGWQAASLY
jgi:hypothetical protein